MRTSTLVGCLLLFATGTPCCSRGGAPGESCLRRIPVLYRRIICGLPESGGPPPPHAFLSGAGRVDRSRRDRPRFPANPSRMPGNRSALLVAGPTTQRGPGSRHHSGPSLGFEPTPIPGCCADPQPGSLLN